MNLMNNKRIVIYGGGTVSYVRNHLALCAPAYGATAHRLAKLAMERLPYMDIDLRLTKMAGGRYLETNEDIARDVDELVKDDTTKIVIMSAALCDFDGKIGDVQSGKYAERLKSREAQGPIELFTADKIIHKIREKRKDIFLTSIRRTNFNDLPKNGLVKIVTDGPDTVLAYGAKPSVGGQSQRIVFRDHPDVDCIVHFHCPIRSDSQVPSVSQKEFECGSHECGHNTSDGLRKFGNLYAVYLDNHGPNIVFNRNIDPHEVIQFIQSNFDLSEKTGGFVSTNHN